ncbi:MAG: M14 family zinc carboxypeptidase, partial [Elusimicrobiota bacterium]
IFIADNKKVSNQDARDYLDFYPSKLPAKEYGGIRDYVTRFLKDYPDGHYHIELMMTPDGIQLIENNTRAGGELVLLMWESVAGINLVEANARLALGLPVPDYGLIRKTDKAGIFYLMLSPQNGRITKLEGLQEAAQQPDVKLIVKKKAGDLIKGPEGGYDYPFSLRVFGKNHAEAERRLREIISKVQFEVDGKPVDAGLPSNASVANPQPLTPRFILPRAPAFFAPAFGLMHSAIGSGLFWLRGPMLKIIKAMFWNKGVLVFALAAMAVIGIDAGTKLLAWQTSSLGVTYHERAHLVDGVLKMIAPGVLGFLGIRAYQGYILEKYQKFIPHWKKLGLVSNVLIGSVFGAALGMSIELVFWGGGKVMNWIPLGTINYPVMVMMNLADIILFLGVSMTGYLLMNSTARVKNGIESRFGSSLWSLLSIAGIMALVGFGDMINVWLDYHSWERWALYLSLPFSLVGTLLGKLVLWFMSAPSPPPKLDDMTIVKNDRASPEKTERAIVVSKGKAKMKVNEAREFSVIPAKAGIRSFILPLTNWISVFAGMTGFERLQKFFTRFSDDRLWVVIAAKDKFERSKIANFGVAIHEFGEGRVAGIVSRAGLERLKKAGVIVESFKALDEFRPVDFPAGDKIFHDYERALAEMRKIAQANPELVSLFSIGKSLEGRERWTLRFNTTEKDATLSKKPGIVFFAKHHAREHLSAEVALKLAQYLVDHKNDPGISKTLAERDIYIGPQVNPDGSEFDIATGRYRWWRKNRSQNKDGTRGVDLNRNYGGPGWGGDGASHDPGDETYHGPVSFSEPETQAVRDFIEARPNIKVLLTYHSFSELILYPWGHKYDPIENPKDRKIFETIARTMAKDNAYTPQPASDLYLASGDTVDWAYGKKGIYAFTVELSPKSLGGGGFYPGPKMIEKAFQDNLGPALFLIDLADNPEKVLEKKDGGLPVAGLAVLPFFLSGSFHSGGALLAALAAAMLLGAGIFARRHLARIIQLGRYFRLRSESRAGSVGNDAQTLAITVKELKQVLGDGTMTPRGLIGPFSFKTKNGRWAKARSAGLEGFLYSKFEIDRAGEASGEQLDDYFAYVDALLAPVNSVQPWRAAFSELRRKKLPDAKKNEEFNSLLTTFVRELTARLRLGDDAAWGRRSSAYMILSRAYNRLRPGKNFFDSLDEEELRRIRETTHSNELWLMDIFEIGEIGRWGSGGGSPYSIKGYRIKTELGGEPAFAALIARAHRTGLRIKVDFIPNHTSLDSDMLRSSRRLSFISCRRNI